MKVLVFGGNGFLGSYIVNELLKRKYTVHIADIKNNNHFNIKFIKCNILSKKEVSDTLSNGYDVVYNLSGFANLDLSINNPYDTLNLNIIGNLNILDLSVKNKIKYYIYASSAYSMNIKGSFYGISKLASEKIIEEYHSRFQLDYTILRYGSVYSETPSENNYLYNLIKNTIATNRIVHNGDGEEVREYIHAKDAATLSVDILEDNKFKNKHLILTGVEKIKRVELFDMIQEILNKKIKIELIKNKNYHHYQSTPYQFQPILSKKLIANPYIDMGQGILEIIKQITSDNNE